MNSENLRSATSSPESAAGLLPCNLPAGLQLDLFGPEVVPVSRSASPASAKGSPTVVTSGPISETLSNSASLQSSLENRLRQRMGGRGSLEYDLTWKHWGMPSGVPICALRAAARKAPFYWLGVTDSGENLFTLEPGTYGNACFGWPTPAVQNSSGGPNPAGNTGEHFTLQTAAVMAGWNTPRATDGSNGGPNQTGGALTPDAHLAMAGWGTPRVGNNGGHGNPGRVGDGKSRLEDQVHGALMAGWVTPSSRDHKDTPGMSLTGTNPDGTTRTRLDQLPRQAAIVGQTSLSSPVATGKRGVLNPDLPRWLMGYPDEWAKYAPGATR